MSAEHIISRLNKDKAKFPHLAVFQTFLRLTKGEEGEFFSEKGRHVMAYTESEDRAFAIARAEMESLGLDISTDKFGNLFGTYYPQDCNPNANAVMSGSHLDSVGTIDKTVGGGGYDGVLGVAAALDAVRAIKEQENNGKNLDLKRPIVIVCWRGEESSLWGRSCLGSSLATGSLQENNSQKLAMSSNGQSFNLLDQLQRLRSAGLAQDDTPVCLQYLQNCDIVEMHIEQGPNVQRGEIGIATTAIAGSIRSVLKFEGENAEEAFHQSVVSIRKIALDADHYAQNENTNRDLEIFRATLNRGTEAFNVGSAKEKLDFEKVFDCSNSEKEKIQDQVQNYLNEYFPKASHSWQNDTLVIECETQFHTGTCPMETREQNNLDALYITSSLYLYLRNEFGRTPKLLGETKTVRLDIRGTDTEYMQEGFRKIIDECEKIAQKLNVSIVREDKGISNPATLNKVTSDLIKEVAERNDFPFQTLVSGAGHDVMKFKKNGLIFIHSERGLSHDPDEYSYPDDIENGTRLLTMVLEELARKEMHS